MPQLSKNLFFFFFLILSFSIHAKKYSYEVGDTTTSTVTEKSFITVFYEVIGLYQKELSQFRIPVAPIPEWTNPYITAYAAEANGVMRLGFWGGMARVPGMNDDAVALIMCHEVGHIIGGAPFIKIDQPMYEGLSSEGQADYFATKECVKKYFGSKKDTLNYLYKVYESNSSEAQLCKFMGMTDLEEAICLRTINGLIGFSHVVELLKAEEGGSFSLLSEDENVVEETLYNSYPSNQCRMDTFLAGLFDQERPLCWYRAD